MDNQNSGKAWLITIIAILATVLFSFSVYKVAATMGLMMTDLNIGTGLGGWLISICTVIGIILCIPAGNIMIKTGPKALVITALIANLAGTVIGLMSASLTILFISRFIEGIGYALIGVAVPPIIAAWFTEEKRGLPMSIFSCWIALGLLAVLNCSNLVVNPANAASWRNVWWLNVVLAVVFLILVALFVKLPKASAGAETIEAGQTSYLKEGLGSAATWLLGIVFFVFAFGCGVVTSFSSTYCQKAFGFSTAQANSYTSLLTIGMIIGGVVAGFILNRTKNRPLVLVITMILSAIVFILTFVYGKNWVMAYMLVGGFIIQMVPATIFTIAPEAAASPATIGITMGVITSFMNLGGLGPSMAGMALEKGFQVATTVNVLISAVGVIAAILFAMAMKKKTV
jgi:Arabinose efflux permease